MNIFDELDKSTAPPSAASKVRKLTREEIDALQASGAITPPELIPRAHMQGRVSATPRFGRGAYSGCSYYGFRGQL